RIPHVLLSTSLMLLATAPVFSASFPDRSIRLIVPFVPGGATDVLARSISEKLSEAMGVTFVIDNRASAGGPLGAGLVAKAAPDGYTLLFNSPSHTFGPSMYKNLPFDAARDFKGITMFARTPNLLVAHPSLPARNVKELIALAHKRPGEVRYGSG